MIAEKFRVIRSLGVGGMGAVYEVEHLFTHHRRALKLLHPEMAADASIVERFLREASAAGRIGNPHIVETFDAGRLPSGAPYLVMELLDGTSLGDAIENHGALPLGDAFAVVAQAADGVHAAHEAGIVHRDIKPDNLFLQRGAPGLVKVLDFGISKFDAGSAHSAALTQEGTALGTPFYMPPEQVRGDRNLDARADVYSLGVVLYECLTGEKPFMAETIPHLAVLIHQGAYALPSTRRAGLPIAADEIVARAMHPNRNERYPSAKAFADALRALDAQHPNLGDMASAAVPSRAFEPLASPLSLAATLVVGATDPADTSAQRSDGARAANEGRPPVSRSRVVMLAFVGALGVGALFLASRQESTPSASPEPNLGAATTGEPAGQVPSQEGRSATDEHTAQPRRAPNVTPELGAPGPPPTSSAPTESEKPSATAPHTAHALAPAGSTRPPPSRAKQIGLSEENPFAK